jgi:hypothetical protein
MDICNDNGAKNLGIVLDELAAQSASSGS